MDFLRTLLAVLFPPRTEEALVLSFTENDVASLIHPKDVHGVRTLADYRDERVRAIVWEAKYHKNERALAYIGRAVARDIEERERGEVLIVPVPLSSQRLAERGYNQVEEALAHGGLHITHALTRTRDTLPQTQLPRAARLTNLAGAFTVSPESRELVRGAHIILVDDVTTTGATLRESMYALRSAGARRIDCLAFARS